ncbi:hypothetical protein ACJBSG_10925 [Streptococcus suis]
MYVDDVCDKIGISRKNIYTWSNTAICE